MIGGKLSPLYYNNYNTCIQALNCKQKRKKFTFKKLNFFYLRLTASRQPVSQGETSSFAFGLKVMFTFPSLAAPLSGRSLSHYTTFNGDMKNLQVNLKVFLALEILHR